ncbi:MAG TPA: cysteine--tRNA ligase [Christensenellaceae bacterium]|nr:cysteine--tRNA ligase [Christensenellaceae bacterium]
MQIFNTMSRRKENFVPIQEGKVGIYACGPTVYNYFHIGNARPFVVFDVLRRYFEYKGYEVKFVQNFTDIDDKMINRANDEGVTVKELGDRFIDEYFKDAGALGVREASVHPRATEHIDAIIKIVELLFKNGHAYEAGGDVYYDTTTFSGYGKLSGQNTRDLNSGARIEVGMDKKHPADFVLWKGAKPGEPSWDSPWGKGRPGWHIECSAMSTVHLGETVDIHCGGQDLIFPHHENEVAQSEGAFGKPFVNYWMHNGFLNIDDEKMSKSAGNFFTVRDILKKYNAETVRMFLLSAHYRNPLNFSEDILKQTEASLQRLYTARDKALFLLDKASGETYKDGEEAIVKAIDETLTKFENAMDDDLNTAEGMGALFELVYIMNTELSGESSKKLVDYALSTLTKICDVLGLLMKDAEELPEEVQKLAKEREIARKEKNWALSDELRDKIIAMGYTVEDTPEGQKIS